MSRTPHYHVDKVKDRLYGKPMRSLPVRLNTVDVRENVRVPASVESPLTLVRYSQDVYQVPAAQLELLLEILRHDSRTGSLTINFDQGVPRGTMQWTEKSK